MDFKFEVERKQSQIDRLMALAEEIETLKRLPAREDALKLLSDLNIKYNLQTDGTNEIEAIFERIEGLENDILRFQMAM